MSSYAKWDRAAYIERVGGEKAQKRLVLDNEDHGLLGWCVLVHGRLTREAPRGSRAM